MRLRPIDYIAFATGLAAGVVTLAFVWMTVRSAMVRELRHAVPALAPYTLIFLVGFGATLWWVRALWRERRWDRAERLGLCPRCGYDIHAAEHDVCPECGYPIWRPCKPTTGRSTSRESP